MPSQRTSRYVLIISVNDRMVTPGTSGKVTSGESTIDLIMTASTAAGISLLTSPFSRPRAITSAIIPMNVGVPFYMPDLKEPSQDDGLPENAIRRYVGSLKHWSRQLERDKKGMKLVTRMIELVGYMFDSLGSSAYERVFQMASPADNEFLSDRIMELLPEGWKKVGSREEASSVSEEYLAWRAVVRSLEATDAGACDAPCRLPEDLLS